MGAERYHGRQQRGHAALGAFADDGLTGCFFQSATTAIQWATWVCAAQAISFFRTAACFLANSCNAAAEITPFLAQSSMNAMLFCRMMRLFACHSGGMSVAFRPSRAD